MMTRERKKLLEGDNLLLFIDNIDVESVSLHLQSKGILPEFVIEKITNAGNSQSARRLLLKEVKCRGDAAFDAFYLALHFARQDNLASLLKEQVSEKGMQTIENQPNQSTTTPERLTSSLSSIKISSPSSKPSTSSSCWLNDDMILKGILNDLSVTDVDGESHEEILKHFEANKNRIYSNFGSTKGLCLIINNRQFFDANRTRVGTEHDCKNLENLFSRLGYTVVVKSDLRGKEILTTVHDFGKDLRHRESSSCVVCILSHGEEDVILGTDDGAVNIHQLLMQLNSKHAPMLTGKPKLVFLQACRGGNYDHGIATTETDCGPVAIMTEPDMFGFNKLVNSFTCVMKQTASPEKIHRIPVEADFLVAYATTPNYVSYRNTMLGSWFVQAICEVFSREACRRDILELMTIVNQRVSTNQTVSNRKQMPEVCSRLRKQFFFYPGIERSSSV